MFGCIVSLFYTILVIYAAASFHRGKYANAAMKPLDLTKEFTFQIRDWAVTPITEITVQSEPCDEPLFQRFWNGTKASRYCYEERSNCTI